MTAITESARVAGAAPAATIAIAAAAASALALLALHVLSPDYQTSWRMVSEYATGRYAWLLTVVFLAWGVAFWALAAAVWPISSTWLGRIGLLFLILAGVGQIMGGIFDVSHRLHGAAFAIGVPSMTIGAVVVALALRRSGADVAMWPAHLTWIGVVLMVVAMGLFFGSLSRAGIEVSAQTGPLAELPQGVRAYHGWANRFLFAASYVWLITTAAVALRGR